MNYESILEKLERKGVYDGSDLQEIDRIRNILERRIFPPKELQILREGYKKILDKHFKSSNLSEWIPYEIPKEEFPEFVDWISKNYIPEEYPSLLIYYQESDKDKIPILCIGQERYCLDKISQILTKHTKIKERENLRLETIRESRMRYIIR